jgi:serine/threonine-protein kinase
MEGQLIGQYRVTGLLGQGGMGAVYSARHTLLDRPAAVKVLLPEPSKDKEIVTRFINEARAATAIRHPGIVEIYEFGRTSDGVAFIVMEHLQGETLGARRRRGPMRWSTSLALARQIAGALAAAHAKGIVHRDLKPANIFLVPDPEVPGGERIKLLDFGIARLAGSPECPNMTRAGAVIGTPTYMAPEQGRGVAIDARVDLYALGCILFELCTGQPPFVAADYLDILIAHRQQPPPTIASLASGVPQEIEALVQRLLAKSPADRVQTANEVIRLIDEARSARTWLEHSGPPPALVSQPAKPRRDTTLSSGAGTRPRPRAASTRRATILGGIGTLAILGTLTLVLVLSNRGGDDESIQGASPPPAELLAAVTPPVTQVAPGPTTNAMTIVPLEPEASAPPASPSSSPASSTVPSKRRLLANVQITIDSTPQGATVVFDDEVLGETPLVAELPRGDQKVLFALRRTGYLKGLLHITPNKASAHQVTLEPSPSPPTTPTPTSQPPPPAPEPTSQPPPAAPPAQPAAPQPSGDPDRG